MSDLEKGYTCECGKFHEYPVYVYAHWGIELAHTCDECKRKHMILEGLATLINEEGEET